MRLFVTCILLCAITLVKAQQGDSLVFLEHAVYTASGDAAKDLALLNKFHYQKATGRYKQAAYTLSRLSLAHGQDTLASWSYQQIALCNYLAGEFGECDYALTRLEFEQPDTAAFYSSLWLKVMCLNQLQRWTEARQYCITMLQHIGRDTAWVDSLYKVSERLKLKSEKKAEALSTFLPGSGQLYAGAGGHGLVNAGIILSCLGWGTYNFFQGYFVTGVFTGYLLGYTFYTGGSAYAVQLVRDYNKRNLVAYIQTLNHRVLMSIKK